MLTVMVVGVVVAFLFFWLFPKKGNDVVQSFKPASQAETMHKEVLEIIAEKLKEAEKQKRTDEAMEILGRLNAQPSPSAKSK